MNLLKQTRSGLYRTWAFGLGMLTILILSGCASMSEQECLTADWYDQGYRDGRRGYPVARVIDHQKACADVGVRPDIERYRAGNSQGVLEYCTPDNAFTVGRAGQSYRNACPAHLEGKFLPAYHQGKRIYEAQRQVDNLNSESSRLQRKLEKEKKPEVQRRLRNELRDLDRRLRYARDTLADLDRYSR
ncbi:DUF2799 domain-containing protein [Castellaniella sp.]|uniref:DUF2799 domain-containing protein n=1 Tax=Castellaniella sp. TaxID=1955812 RepID=UPI002AFEF2DB|nr:DUF2799 domain-containing protein [Castellaniella sp.]